MTGYTAKQVAKLLDLPVGRVRAYARAGFLHPARGPRGEYRFSFQDLVLLRTAQGLLAARIPPRRVRRALHRLQQQLPRGRPLSGLQIVARGDHVMVRSGETLWDAESGQAEFDFEIAELAAKVRPHAREAYAEAREGEDGLTPEDWFTIASELETSIPEEARDAYRRALELDPHHVDSRVNLGRLLHEAGRLHSAQAHYRLALADEPGNVTALFNLGVSLEDLGRLDAAAESYRAAITHDPKYADAYFNLARLLEKTGDSHAALRYLRTYRKLTETT